MDLIAKKLALIDQVAADIYTHLFADYPDDEVCNMRCCRAMAKARIKANDGNAYRTYNVKVWENYTTPNRMAIKGFSLADAKTAYGIE